MVWYLHLHHKRSEVVVIPVVKGEARSIHINRNQNNWTSLLGTYHTTNILLEWVRTYHIQTPE